MTQQPVILVGVDGGDAGMGAVKWALAQAEKTGMALHLVCAYSLPSFTAATMDGGYAVIDESRVRDSAEEVLDAAEALVAGKVPVTRTVETGDPATVLAELSRGVQLVVIGKPKGHSFADRILGSVSSTLPPHTHCPTVIVPVGEGISHVPIRKIVAGVDGSEPAHAALVRAIEEAVRWEASLTVISAVSLATSGAALSWGLAPIDPDQLLADVQQGVDEAVVAAQAEVPGARDLTVERHALGGSGAALITEFSTAVDLVVLGNRGRGGFAGLLLGSTSQSVIQHAACPVMVIPSGRNEGGPVETYPWQ